MAAVRLSVLTLLALMLVVAGPLAALADQHGDRGGDPGGDLSIRGDRVILSEEADYFGYDYRRVEGTSLKGCQNVCLKDGACQAFTYNTEARWCFLKNGFEELRPFAGAVAGRVVRAAAAAAPPAKPLTFVPSSLLDETERFAASLRNSPVAGDRRSAVRYEAGLSAFGDGDLRRAREEFRAAAALDPKNASGLQALSRTALQIEARDYRERLDLEREATAAAALAYRAAGTLPDRAEALADLSRALQRRQLYRPAIEAYKTSLELADSAEVRAALDKLRQEYGFRVVNHAVDAESASPRACVEFSERLQEGAAFDSFVTVNEAPPPALEVEAQQLCIPGLKHGERYRVALRAGLPSSVGETIESPVVLDIYVRDRSPSARFTGRNFVLPRTGSRGIPVISVNSSKLLVSLYGIGERALAGAVVDREFLGQLNGFSAERLGTDKGTKLWSGELDVAAEPNREVTTSFPIDEVLPERQPGVYVMVARPAEAQEEDWRPDATQWFTVSDIGLTALSGPDGLHVFARSLADTAPLGGLNLALVARNNNLLAKVKTDARGYGRFDPGLLRGEGGQAPALLQALSADAGFVFLDLTEAGFDLSDRGVDGRPAPGAIDAYLYTERGVYRPGSTVYVSALVRDGEARALAGVPVTFVFERPDGVEFRRLASADAGAGGHAVELALPGTATRGTWQVRLHADPQAPAIASAKFLVEDFIPERIDFELTSAADRLALGARGEANVEGRFLYGAPAAGLRVEGEIEITPSRELDGFAGYRFGLADDDVPPLRQPLSLLGSTDEAGLATIPLILDELPATTMPLQGEVRVRMLESGGRAVERRLVLPIAAQGPRIGIRPLFAEDRVGEGDSAEFAVIGVDADGGRIPLGAQSWQLLKLERSFQWYNAGGNWNYEPVTFTRKVADGTVDIGRGEPARVSVPVEWGRYRLEVASADPSGPASSVEFVAGWYVDVESAETPDVAEVTLDKPAYRAGDTARVSIRPRFDGTALVNVVGERLLASREIEVSAAGTVIELPIGADWGGGAYVTATVVRGMDVAAGRNPARAVGLSWLAVDSADKSLDVGLDLPATAPPREMLAVPVRITGANPGERAYMTVAAVDVGILNLTAYQPPDPGTWFFGQRRLGMEMRDIYGRLIDGMAGASGRVRSGGGEAGLTMQGAPPSQKPLALFSGIVEVGADGTAVAAFELPEFNGTVKVMAVAWTASAVGAASGETVVRDPVVVTASLPRVLAPGDEARLLLEIANTDGPAGAYEIGIEASGELVAGGKKSGAAIELSEGERRTIEFPLVAERTGDGQLTVRLTGQGIDVAQRLALQVRPAQLPVSERRVVELAANGGELTVGADLIADWVPGTGEVTFSATRAGGLDIASMLVSLDRYPYGCSEQIASRALPLLYLASVAAAAGVADASDLEERVQKAIYDLLSNQSSIGSFGLWSAGSGDMWLDAYVTDFLTRAKEEGYKVPELAFAQALDNLRNRLAYAGELRGGGEDIAYALYVLARNRKASIGDLRYYADAKLEAFGSALAKAQIGAALALYGETERAARAMRAALAELEEAQADDLARSDYGSRLRDGAAMLTLVAETTPAPVPTGELRDLVARLAASAGAASTQENAWMLLAANALLEGGEAPRVEIDGEIVEGNVVRRFGSDGLARPLRLVNRGTEPLPVVVTVRGVPVDPLPAGGQGFTIARTYYSLDGEVVDISQAGQNERFVVVLQVGEENAWVSRVLVADLLPAGFEIDNPNLVAGASLAAFSWLPEDVNPARVEFRDDRFVAAFDRTADSPRRITLAYMVRAVTPGRYTHPPAIVEDMYRPQLSARTAMGAVEIFGPRR